VNLEEFQRLIRQKGEELYRDMPWREDTRPYYVLVSELMLQQTQVARVVPKFQEFIAAFPSEKELAAASLADVLIQWQGLGYNRRAKFLHEAAKEIVKLGGFPDTYSELVKLPGVGKNTAGAILAYSFNHPSIFVETNIRTVYIHHFFADEVEVPDAAIVELLRATVPQENAREWYWALMDYGTYVKQTVGNKSRASKSYAKQTRFEGSKRQVRGQVLRALHSGPQTFVALHETIQDDRLPALLNDLVGEGFIRTAHDDYMLA